MTGTTDTDPDTVAMLRDAMQRYAAEQYGFGQRRAFLDAGLSERAWRDYADFGWLALRLPEDDGGIGADAAATGALMEVVGGWLLMEPVLASAVVGTGLVLAGANTAQRAALLPALSDGTLRLAVACDDTPSPGRACTLKGDRLHGAQVNVLHGDVADRLVVSARDADGAAALCLVDPSEAGVERRPYRLVDGRGAASLLFEGARVERLAEGDAASAVALARDEAAVALCAEAVGVVRRLINTTCDYLKVRKQFGRTIGSNQVLQHRMVELFLLQQEMQALTRAAQHDLGAEPARRARSVSGARAYVATAARRVANDAVQMHGGLGITEELDISHCFRRVMVINALFGGRDEHFTRFVEATA
jgi:alkylation response protein AidB-like acyl-CoA dehydrogenase